MIAKQRYYKKGSEEHDRTCAYKGFPRTQRLPFNYDTAGSQRHHLSAVKNAK
jgi:hypothetical protein